MFQPLPLAISTWSQFDQHGKQMMIWVDKEESNTRQDKKHNQTHKLFRWITNTQRNLKYNK